MLFLEVVYNITGKTVMYKNDLNLVLTLRNVFTASDNPKWRMVSTQQHMRSREKTSEWLINRNYETNNSSPNFDIEVEKERKKFKQELEDTWGD